MRLTDTLSQWILDQLDSVPTGLLRQGAELLSSDLLLDRVLGQSEANELRAMLSRPARHESRPATVLLPGLMGSMLASVRGISSMLWMSPTILADGHLNLLELDQTGRRDRSPDVDIVPVGIEKLSYLKIILSLARETRLYEFPYDWRRRIEHNADVLHQSMLRWSSQAEGRRFSLIGHSLGGIIARTYLALYPEEAEALVERVILLASPIYGSAKTLLSFSGQLAPARVVSRLHPDNDVVGLTKNMPVSYQLLPPPPSLFRPDRPYPADWDLYDAHAWPTQDLRQDYLDATRQLYECLDRSDPQVEIYQIAGCHQATVSDVRLPQSTGQIEPLVRYDTIAQSTGPESGDDTVPLWSVCHPHVETMYIQERHQQLPNNETVIHAVLDLVHDQPAKLPRELPTAQPPSAMDRVDVASIFEQVNDLRQRIRSGEFSREDLERILFQR